MFGDIEILVRTGYQKRIFNLKKIHELKFSKYFFSSKKFEFEKKIFFEDITRLELSVVARRAPNYLY